MAADLPMINAWLPTSMPDVSLHGVTGHTVPPRDVIAPRAAMLRLWTDTDLRAIAHPLSIYDELSAT